MKVFTGIVTSAKLEKTVTVEIAHSSAHPLYGKRIKKTKNYLCHAEMALNEGDMVEIQETRPISKNKRFKVTKVVKATTRLVQEPKAKKEVVVKETAKEKKTTKKVTEKKPEAVKVVKEEKEVKVVKAKTVKEAKKKETV